MLLVAIMVGEMTVATYSPPGQVSDHRRCVARLKEDEWSVRVKVRTTRAGDDRVKIRLCQHGECDRWVLDVDSTPFHKSIRTFDRQEPILVDIKRT